MPSSSITTLEQNDVLQWDTSVRAWQSTTVLAGVAASTIIAGGTQGQALTSKGSNSPKFEGMTTQGDVEYYSGTARTRLAPGTSGQFLQTKGASANPVWASPAVTLIGTSNTQIANTDDTNENTVYTLTIPATTANDVIRIRAAFTGHAGVGVTTQIQIKIAGTTVAQISSLAGSSAKGQIFCDVANRNDTSSQINTSFAMDANTVENATFTTTAIGLGSAQNLTVTMLQSSSGGTAASLEYINVITIK